MHNLNRKCEGGNILLKIDMAKAYDKINWGFLLRVLSAFGFLVSWRNLILNCIASSMFYVMMNGTP